MPPSEQDIRNRLLVARLPALPQIILKLLEYCQSDNVGMAELAEIIAKDAAIASKILGIANSSAFHRNGQKVRLEQSLISIGTDTIRVLAISESVFQTFNSFSNSARINLRGFWKHALTAAVMARGIAKKMAYPNIDEAYLGGLLHDIGRLAFLAIAPHEYAHNFHAKDDENLCSVEQRTMQISHPEAGAWLLERWKLDPLLADSVLYHHEPLSRIEAAPALTRIVYLAHHLAAHGHEDLTTIAAGSLCQLQPDALEDITRHAYAQVEKAASQLGIDLAGADEIPSHTAFVAPSPAQKKMNDALGNMIQTTEAARIFAKHSHEAALLESIARSACVLFQLDEICTLVPDGATLKKNLGDPRLKFSGIALSAHDNSIVSNAFSQRKILCAIANEVVSGGTDAQLLQILGTETLICLPLSHENACMGILVGGTSTRNTAKLQGNVDFLHAFATQAGLALHTLRGKQVETPDRHTQSSEDLRAAALRVAHEVNNPLSIIKNYLTLLSDKLARQDQAMGDITLLHAEIDRVGQIVRQFADPKKPLDTTVTNLNLAIHDVIRFFSQSGAVPESIAIHVRTENMPSEIRGELVSIKQILMNLIKNATEAMSTGGQIIIENQGYVVKDGKTYVSLMIQDSGAGLPAVVLQNMEGPKFSEKSGAVRGLGLSIVYELVAQFQGFISCESSEKGTSFQIHFPAGGAAMQDALS